MKICSDIINICMTEKVSEGVKYGPGEMKESGEILPPFKQASNMPKTDVRFPEISIIDPHPHMIVAIQKIKNISLA